VFLDDFALVELSTIGSSLSRLNDLLIALHRAIGSVNWSDEPLTVMTTASLKWRYQRLWSKRYRFLRAICGFAF
jgi:hypothetical protein